MSAETSGALGAATAPGAAARDAGTARYLAVLGVLAAVLVVVLIGAATLGPYRLSPAEVVGAVWRRLAGQPVERVVETVLFNIRLPRIATAALVGASLAAAGAAYQSLFRNPLVSPDILGVSTGAGLGAVTAILLSLPVFAIQLFGFVGGVATVLVVMALTGSLRGGNRLLTLVLSGIVVGALASAAISLVKVLADPYDQLPTITFWLLGSLARITSADLRAVLPAVAVGLVPLVLLRWRIGVLSLGDDEARALGIEPSRLRLIVIGAATMVTAAVVAISGVVGWVGLMVPHMGRFLVGPRFDRLLPVSLLAGAVFMVAVDTLARTMAAVEVPLGILTAALGAPLFVALLARGRRVWS